jgi:BirA family transcriptional regulator, biotin operon repressor / biotin---[acetyl-CoA-carboxylase] ligase
MNDLELLDAKNIHHAIEQMFPHTRFILDVLPAIDSTNRYLLEKNPENLHICLAEQQTAGRGRQGKTWVSPFGVNLYCSVLWPFKKPVSKLMGLSLMTGVIVANTLEDYGASNIGLKWPNDVYVEHNKKIAGILIESVNEQKNLHKTVIGIGLNVGLSNVLNPQDSMINQPWTDLKSIVNFPPDRTQLAIILLTNLLTALPRFEEHGFSAFNAAWLSKDVLLNQPVTLQASGKLIEGTAKGVDETGRLIVENGEGFHYFNSADICKSKTT